MKSNWSYKKIINLRLKLIDGDRGKNYPKQDDFSSEGYCLFLNTGNVTTNGFDFSSNSFISKEKDSILRKGKLQRNDIILTTRGTIGNVALYSNSIAYENVRINSGMLIVRPDKNEFDCAFLYQLLCSPNFKEQVRQFQYGAAQPQLPIRTLNHIKLPIPSLPTQRKIAAILSAYDDLIENNRKRIKLLEEKAQLTYEEWFVRMKFPGHERTPINEETGLPEGWKLESFSKAVQLNPRTKISKGKIAPYIPMGSLSETGMVIDPIEERAASGGAKFQNGDTLFARITPCLENGKTGFVQFMDSVDQIATGSTEFIVFRETETVGRHFIYCTSRSERFRELAIKSMAGSDGRQRVKNESFEKFDFKCPPADLMGKFEESAFGIFSSIQTMIKQNQLLKEARDILLPRLMTGIIDVESLDLSAFEDGDEEGMLMAAEPGRSYSSKNRTDEE